MTPLRQAIAAAAGRLTDAGVASPRADAEELAAHVLGVGRGDLVRHEEIDGEAYTALVEARAARRPLQHLTGVAHFRYVTLEVGTGVFVPRPETEVMVGQMVEAARALPAGALAVDLCSGSGAIALCLATEVPGLVVHAVELDPGAVAWARRNLAGSGVLLHQGDAADALPDLDGTVDLVVSNPPYIPLVAWESIAVEVRDHDPAPALWGGGDDGLDVVRAVERTAGRLLRPGGRVAVEHADVQGEAVVEIFARTGRWSQVRGHRDLTDRDRFVTAIRG
ncbi:peptide chain release factor N(5)-glutamine methyltransferase [Sporichthya sp.]|uniref:peptide chain release factor N(5)-glutamine methyltransferase n=1 Tax=Sporichthya sp. TaxID=65475 RepID=UPI001828EAA5|nr:peptide chain release factor N(5)-glutamine methyltransferase [Sporichthya sp.]MBA3743113.1 peptide chain release factor N(5)-glutamine methyltransferase [Sporichthya sp.]